MANYEQLVERISKSSGLDKEEIERKIEAKKAKLSGLISKEGAAQIVAAELGINFDNEKLKISELVQGMKRANLSGKIVKLNPVREFSKDGKEGKVASFLLADETSNIRTVLWDTNHISLIESGKIKENSVVDISNGNMRNGELHLSSFADIKESKEKIENVILERSFNYKKLKEVHLGEDIKTRAVIVKAFEPRYFEVCPQCGKKAVNEECRVHGKVTATKRALLNIILDDGTETIRSVIFGDEIQNLGLTKEQIFSLDEYNKIKDNFLGEEMSFSGQIRNNALYNTTEFTIEGIKKIDPNELVKELEAKA
jgi:ssDNA-binding replication factor A large subunit